MVMESHTQPHSCLLLPLCKAGLTFPTPEMCRCHLCCAGQAQGWSRAGEGEGEGGGRFDTRGVKVLGDALKLMPAWRRRKRNTVQGHRGCLELPTEQSLHLVKAESTPESRTYLSQHPGQHLLQPASSSHWVHVQGITLLQPCFLLFLLLFFLRYVLGRAGIHSSITPPAGELLDWLSPACHTGHQDKGGWAMILRRQDGLGYPHFARKMNSFLAAWILHLFHGNSCLASCRASS